MTDLTNVTAVDPIALLTQQYLTRIADSLPRIKGAVEHVTACKFTHRRHTLRHRALWPAQQILTLKDTLPKPLWMSTAGAFLVEALEQLAELEQEVFKQRKAATFVEVDRALVLCLDPSNGEMEKVAEKTQRLVLSLNDQLLVKERGEIIALLQELLRDADPAVAEVREALRDRLISFIEHQIDLAATEAGYRTVRAPEEMGATMLPTAESLIRQMWALNFTFVPNPPVRQAAAFTLLSEPVEQPQAAEEPRQIGQVPGKPELRSHMTVGIRAALSLDLNRVLTLGVLALSDLAQDYASLRANSTVSGRMQLLADCLSALEPAPSEKASHELNHVERRMKYGHERMVKAVSERTEQLGRDLHRACEGIDRATKIIYEVAGLCRACKESARR